MAVPEENLPLWQKIPEGLKLFLTGAGGGLIIGALLGLGLMGVV